MLGLSGGLRSAAWLGDGAASFSFAVNQGDSHERNAAALAADAAGRDVMHVHVTAPPAGMSAAIARALA